MNSYIDLHALWRIIVVGVIAGAGLPAVFALGLRALDMQPAGATAGAEGQERLGRNPLGLVLAVLCFAVVLAGIVWGVYLIVDGT